MKKLNLLQKFSILIPILYIIGEFISYYVERFRADENLHWIYNNGKDLSLLICYGAVFWSLINSILIVRELKTKTLYKIFWFLLSISTFLNMLIRIIKVFFVNDY